MTAVLGNEVDGIVELEDTVTVNSVSG